jgi:hypothetical protein
MRIDFSPMASNEHSNIMSQPATTSTSAAAPANGTFNDPRQKQGYQRLGEYMAWNPAQVMFSRFRAANLTILLLLQAEIVSLEEELDDIIWDDNDSGDAERYSYCRNWETLCKSGPNGQQLQKVMTLKGKLLEYSK